MNRRELLQLAAAAGAAAIATKAAGAESTPAAAAPAATRIQMLVYPGMTLQDLVGPLQVWAAWPGVELQFAWKSAGPVTTDSGLAVVATTAFEDAWTAPDILFAPGGLLPTFELLDDATVVDFLRSRGAQAKWVTSVCTGAVLLGAAGLLRGYRAATHWFARDALALFGATPSNERWVIDRNRATGGGVTAGIDFGLALMAHVAGPELARITQLALEYSPQPPFRSGTPQEAAPETLAALRAAWGGELGQRIQSKIMGASRRLQG
ncbi:MAG TPA: DJ-1/PfpI family protein [Steroidobacteraceae bacterium]|jgi:cyclohexyl-isocyanide hydratase|nr:DJ-1/PfpI family protein [Steroidobacteraceae bacterium]